MRFLGRAGGTPHPMQARRSALPARRASSWVRKDFGSKGEDALAEEEHYKKRQTRDDDECSAALLIGGA